MRAALRSSRGCNGESHSKYVVGLDFIDRIVGVSPRHLHARIGLAVLIQTYKHIETTLWPPSTVSPSPLISFENMLFMHANPPPPLQSLRTLRGCNGFRALVIRGLSRVVDYCRL